MAKRKIKRTSKKRDSPRRFASQTEAAGGMTKAPPVSRSGWQKKFAKRRTHTKALAQTPRSGWQLRANDGQGPYTSYFNSFVPRKIEASFYEFLREAIPIIDAAFRRLTSLDGHIVVKGDNEAIVEEIQEWIYNVPVNDIQRGLQAFHQNFTNEAFEQGFSIGEFVVDKKRTDIIGLRVADSKWIKFKRTDNGLDIYQKADNDLEERLLKSQTLLYFSIDNENQNPYGIPLMRSCEFVSKILVTMQNSIANVWERFGDPSFSIIYKTSKREGADLTARRKTIEDEFNTAIRAKREGKSADFVRALDKDSSIDINIIGANGQVLELEVPSRHVMEQIIAKTGLPPWMLGMHWSTTERLSNAEAEMLLADVATRQSAKMPLFYNLVRTLLLLRGRTWKKGDWWLEWGQVNLHDIVAQAQARFLNAQADMYYMQNADKAGIELNINDLAIGKAFRHSREGGNPEKKKLDTRLKHSGMTDKNSCSCGAKELRRPTPWPELDRVENEYEAALKDKWDELQNQIFLILKLPQVKTIQGSRHSDLFGIPLKKDAAGMTNNQKEDIPGLEAFTFTEEQRAQIMQATKDWIGTFNIDDEDSVVRWYYGQAYSLGLIQAVKLIGKDRPILDIIKNNEIYDELCKNGFQFVKDNATTAITNKILPAMQAHVIAGSNPVSAASVLKKLFGDQNSDWERLARTEMSSAAEQAKLDEWAEWEVKMVEFTPAPDACPFCFSLAGDYKIGECPIPGTGTHPFCRCSVRPAESEIG